MVREVIGSLWDRTNRNSINSNFEELYDKSEIKSGDITSDKIADGSITEKKLGYRSVGATAIKDYSITNLKIDSGAVGNRSLALGGVWRENIQDGAVNNQKLSSEVYGRNLEGLTNANTLVTPGIYTVNSGENATESLAFPPGNQFGVLDVRDAGLNIIVQTYTMPSKGEVWTRRRYIGTWSEWVQVGQKNSAPSLNKEDLNNLTTSGQWKQNNSVNATIEQNYPPVTGQYKAGALSVVSSGGVVTQTYTADRAGEIWVRDRLVGGTWNDWKRVGDNSSQEVLSEIPKTTMELTGRWTPNKDGDEFILQMGKHELVETIEIGQSVQGNPLYAAIIGDKTKPALLVNAGAHGTEVGTPEGAWLWIKELINNKTLMFMDMCIIVVPNQNPDNRFIARGNKNAVDLNRDWGERTQPETRAVESLLNDFEILAAVDVHNFGYEKETSFQESTYGQKIVKEKSLEIYNAAYTALEKDGQPVIRYAPELPESSFVNGIAIGNNIPTLLIEIPCGGYGEWTFDDYFPTPNWQAHIFITACNAVAEYVWKNIFYFTDLVPGA